METFYVILGSLVVQGASTPLKVFEAQRRMQRKPNFAREWMAAEKVEEKRQQATKSVEKQQYGQKTDICKRKI